MWPKIGLDTNIYPREQLEHERSDLPARPVRERTTIVELRAALNQKPSEIESARKSANRDRPINLNPQDVSPVSTLKHDRDSREVKGLK